MSRSRRTRIRGVCGEGRFSTLVLWFWGKKNLYSWVPFIYIYDCIGGYKYIYTRTYTFWTWLSSARWHFDKAVSESLSPIGDREGGGLSFGFPQKLNLLRIIIIVYVSTLHIWRTARNTFNRSTENIYTHNYTVLGEVSLGLPSPFFGRPFW